MDLFFFISFQFKPSCFFLLFFFLVTDKSGAKGQDGKSAKKASVSKPNSIKSMFMNSNVKKPAEVSDHVIERILFHSIICRLSLNQTVYYGDVWVVEKRGPVQR